MKNYILCETRSGFKTLIYKDHSGGRDIRLHSAYDPYKEAGRSVSGFEKGRSSVVLVSGLALGYHVDHLAELVGDTQILVIEKDPEAVRICSEVNPEIFKKAVIITSTSEIESFFEKIDLSEFNGISHYIHRPSFQIDPEFYETITGNIIRYVSSRVSDLLTRFEFEERWIRNIFRNLKHLASSEGVGRFFGVFKGYPGIIVSAGPSLKNNIRELEKLRNSAVIVAVDTAYKVLSRYNITPHFVVTLDAQKYSSKHFLGVQGSGAVLVADIVSCPSILNSYTGEKVISTTSKYFTDAQGHTRRETTPVMDWVEKYTGHFGDIQSGGSVATTVFDMLLNFGCDPIILVGQDLAYTGREIHCTGTYHNDDWLPGINRLKNLECINQGVIRKRKIKYVTGYGGRGSVITDFVFDLYKSWFEDSSGRVAIDVINATEGGAFIQNTTESALSLSVRSNDQRRSPDKVICNLFENPHLLDISKLKKGLSEVSVDLDKLIQALEDNDITNNRSEDIDRIINDDNLAPLFRPLLRKVNMFLARRNMKGENSEEMLIQEIRVAALKLKGYISESGLC